MAKNVKIVIGANYGDEGKGLVSYCLSKEAVHKGEKVLNVLFNGGAQRGHTAAGRVYHCQGAGEAIGADTYYNKWFMVDPIAMWIDDAKRVYIHPECRVVLPCDVVNNQRKELMRGEKRHGSCGMGIFEACKRCVNEQITISIEDIFDDAQSLYNKLIKIEERFGFPRDFVYNNDNFMRACAWVKENCYIVDDFRALFKEYDTIIYEGGQGLLLDQRLNEPENGNFTTPSNTGVQNCISEVLNLDCSTEIFYVSRSYITRHGVGNIAFECSKDEINPAIYDETNKTNPWQGSLRYGYLFVDGLFERISVDFEKCKLKLCGTILVTPPRCNVVFTHLNESNGSLVYKEEYMSGYGILNKPGWINHIYASDRKDEMEIWK